jgi:hypothetical protein
VRGNFVSIELRGTLINDWFNVNAFTEAVGHFGSTPRDRFSGAANEPLALFMKKKFSDADREATPGVPLRGI